MVPLLGLTQSSSNTHLQQQQQQHQYQQQLQQQQQGIVQPLGMGNMGNNMMMRDHGPDSLAGDVRSAFGGSSLSLGNIVIYFYRLFIRKYYLPVENYFDSSVICVGIVIVKIVPGLQFRFLV